MTYNRSDHPETHEMIGQRYLIVRQLREEPWGGVWLAQDNTPEDRGQPEAPGPGRPGVGRGPGHV